MTPPHDPIDDELQFHFDTTVDALVTRGWTRDDAIAEANRRFGDLGRWRTRLLALRQRRQHPMTRLLTLPRAFGGLRRDLQSGWRSLRHAPALSIVTVLTFAIGLGGTATMFAAVNAAFLTPLPFPDEDGLVKVYQAGGTRIAYGVARDWQRDSRTLTSTAAYFSGVTANVAGGDDAFRARVARVTRPFFSALGVAPARGRIFSDAELVQGAAPVVVISHELWQRVFGGGDLQGQRPLRLEGLPIAVVGVMPQGFSFPDGTEIWAPLEPDGPDAFGTRTAHNFDVLARLAPGATVETAARELTSLFEQQKRTFPEMAKEDPHIVIRPLRTDLLGTQAQMIWIGLGAVICVLLVACVNVANLMFTRSLTREAELGIRVALGAGRATIVRGVLVEGLLLAAAGAIAGMALARAGIGLISALAPEAVTGGRALAIDARVMALTGLATALAGVLSAVLPAIRASKIDPRHALAQGARTVAGAPRRVMHTLVGVEVALAFVLLFSATLLAQSHARLSRVDPGFRTSGLTLARFSLGLLPGSAYDAPANRRTYFERLEDAIDHIPGVRGTALAAIMPPGGSPNGRFVIEGRPEFTPGAHFRLVGGDYFRVMRIPIRRGRVFTPDDDGARPQVAVINDTLARLAFPDVNPIGQVVSMPGMDGGQGTATIVGIVADVRHRGPARPPVAEAYFSYRQRPWRTYGMTLIVDSEMTSDVTTTAIRAAARRIDPLVPPEMGSMETLMAPYIEPSRFRARLLVAVAGVALGLALVGIGGVVSHVAARRRREMGIRAALGARPSALAALVVMTGMRPVLIGAACGALLSLAAGRVLEAFVFDVSARDAGSLILAAVAIVATGIVASWWPARKSAGVDPVSVLRV